MTVNLKLVFSLLTATGSAMLGVYLLNRPDLLYPVYTQSSYYILGLLVLSWCITLYHFSQQERFSLKQWLKENFSGLIIILLLSVIVFISVKPQFRILNDEINLVAISRSLFYEKRVDVAAQTDFYALEYIYSLGHKLANKPLLFPFFIHLLHVLSGYRPENVFALNFMVLAGILIAAFAVIKKRLEFGWAIASLILILSQPVVLLTATSGIYDLFGVFFLMLCYLSVENYRKNPTEVSFRLLWLNFIMLAHIRYESILFLAVVLSALLVFRMVRFEYFKKSYFYSLTLLFLMPCFWLKEVLPKNILQVPAGEPAFSISSMLEHNITFLKIFLKTDYTSAYANLICLFGSIAVFYFGIKLITSSRFWADRQKVKFSFLYAMIIAGHWILITSFHAARPMSGVCGRYYLFFVILWTLSAVFLLKKMNIKAAGAIGIAIIMFVLYQPVCFTGPFLRNTSANARAYRAAVEMLKEQNDPKALLLAKNPYIYAVNSNPVMGINYANKQENRIFRKFKTGGYSNIYVLQHIHAKTMQPLPGSRIAPVYKLETIDERQYRDTRLVSNTLNMEKNQSQHRFLKAGLFLAISFFMIYGPLYNQVLSSKKSKLFHSWDMFPGKALDFYAVSYFVRTPKGDVPLHYHKFVKRPSHKGGRGRLWKIDDRFELKEAHQAVCDATNYQKDIRVQAKQATRQGWKVIANKEKNICKD
jgi:hypothetical protein